MRLCHVKILADICFKIKFRKEMLTLRNLSVEFNQMARKFANREYRQRPGLRAAAKDLAVSYSHLRRVAIKERTSVSLMKRFRAWQRQQRAASKTPNFTSPNQTQQT
jgi:hypothetical protein